MKTSSTSFRCNNFSSPKTYWKRVAKTSWRRLEDISQGVLKTSWKTKNCYICLEDVLKTCLEDVLKTYVLKTSSRRLLDIKVGISVCYKSKSANILLDKDVLKTSYDEFSQRWSRWKQRCECEHLQSWKEQKNILELKKRTEKKKIEIEYTDLQVYSTILKSCWLYSPFWEQYREEYLQSHRNSYEKDAALQELYLRHLP